MYKGDESVLVEKPKVTSVFVSVLLFGLGFGIVRLHNLQRLSTFESVIPVPAFSLSLLGFCRAME